MYQFLVICFALATLQPTQGQSLRCLTYNIRYDNPSDGEDAWPKRRAFLAAQIRFHAPDVFGIQEGLLRQVNYLKETLPEFAMVGVGRDDGKEAGEFSALFYRIERFKLLDSGTFWLSSTPEKPSKGWDAALERICTWALLLDKRSHKKVWVFNTHYDHIGKLARQASSELILKQIATKNTKNDAVVVMGDLNSEPDDTPITTFKTQLLDTKEASLAPAFGPSGTFNAFEFHKPVTRRIDYIFMGKGKFKVKQYAVLSDSKDCHYPSDHLPVLAVLDWN
jgi:endonuclease/exonuclease/phosphatase family metal-dependent hydrolase